MERACAARHEIENRLCIAAEQIAANGKHERFDRTINARD